MVPSPSGDCPDDVNALFRVTKAASDEEEPIGEVVCSVLVSLEVSVEEDDSHCDSNNLRQ